MYDTNMQGWGPTYVKSHPDVTMAQVDQFLTNMYKKTWTPQQAHDEAVKATRDLITKWLSS